MTFSTPIRAAVISLTALLPAVAGNVFVVPAPGGTSVGIYGGDPFQLSNSISGTSNISAVYALPGGQYYVVTYGANSAVYTYNSSFQPGPTITGVGVISASAVSPAGDEVALMSNDGLRLVDTKSNVAGALIAASKFGSAPYDVSYSLNGQRLYVASGGAAQVTAVDLTGSPVVESQVVAVSGGQLPILLTTGPDGLIYASTQNLIVQIDGGSMTVHGKIPLNGTPDRLVFAPDMSVAMAVNRVPANGGNILTAVDPIGLTTLGAILTSSVNDQLDQLYYAGPTASSSSRFYANSLTKQVVYEITYPSLNIKQASFISGLNSIVAIVPSEEVTAPKYLFVADTSSINRTTLTTAGDQAGQPLLLSDAPSNLFNGAAFGPGTPAKVLAYNATQSISAAGDPFLPICARVLDSNGKPISGAAVTFKSSNTSVIFNDIASTTNASGWAFATPSSALAAGNYPITVTSGSVATTGTLSVSTGGGGGAGTAAGITPVSGQGQLITPGAADNPVPAPFIVQVTNDAGQPLSNVLVTFSLDQGGLVAQLISSNGVGDVPGAVCSSGALCTGRTNTDGKVAAVIFPNQLTGNTVPFITGKITAKTSANRSTAFYFTILANNATAVITFTDPASGTLTAPAGSKLVGAVKASVSAYSLVSGYMAIPNIGLSVATPAPDPQKGPSASCDAPGGVALSDANGNASCDLVAGPVTGTTTLNIYFGIRQSSAILTVVPGQPAHINIEQGNNQSGTPGTKLPLALRANVTDVAGNLVVGQKVNWAVGNPQAVTLSNVVSISDLNGRVSAIATLGSIPGPQTVTVSVPGTSITATFNLTVTGGFGGLAITGGNDQTALVDTAFGQPLAVQLTDTSNPPKGVAGVAVTFNVQGGGATLSAGSATTDANGNASVTATAGNTPGPVTVVASAGNLSVTFHLTVRPLGPVFGLSNLLNGASFQVQKQVAPGQILTVTGTGVSNGAVGVVVPNSMVGPLPTTLNGVQVGFYQGTSTAGTLLQAPIYNVANVNSLEQVTVLVPFELQPGIATMVIKAGGTASDPLQVPVVVSQPGIFMTTDANNNTYAVVLHSNGSYVSPTNPAAPGETLRMFVTSLGQTSPSAGSYRAGVQNQLVTGTVIVGVADAGAQVIESKYVEDFVGLYTVDFVVPSGAPSGTAVKLNLALLAADSSLWYSNATSVAIQ